MRPELIRPRGHDCIDPFIRRFGHALQSVQHVRIVSGPAGQQTHGPVAGQHIVESVTGSRDGGVPEKGELFHVRPQHHADIRLHRVDPFP